MGNSRWRSAVALFGACGSLAATLWVGRNAPRALLVLFLVWVLSPFAALLVADRASSRWAIDAQPALQRLAPLIALASLAVYAAATRWTRPTPAFLLVPLASWLVIAIGAGRIAWMARKR